MHFHEEAVRARRRRRARQRPRELRRATGLLPFTARLLHRMRDVVDHRRAEAAHDRERAHVDDEVLIAERRAALGDENALVAYFAPFVQDVLRLLGREELSLLHRDRFARARRGRDDVGLPAEERRNLQDVEHCCRQLGLLPLVDVGEHRQPGLFFDRAQNLQSFVQSRPPKRLN